MPTLDTTYLGLTLRSPIVASAGPLTGDPDTAARLADAGAGAIVLPSLFEEEIVHEQVELDVGAGSRHRALRRGDRLLPRHPGLPERCRPLSGQPREDQGERRGPGDRQPQRLDTQAVGAATPACSATPAPTPSSSTCTGWRPIRPAAPTRWNTTTSHSSPTSRPPSTSRWRSSCHRSTRRWPTSPCKPYRPAPTGSSCSTASTNQTSTSRRSRSLRVSSCRRGGSCACRCAGSPSSTRSCRAKPASPPPAASRPDSTSPRHSSSAPTSR